jgi:hypothetical protein
MAPTHIEAPTHMTTTTTTRSRHRHYESAFAHVASTSSATGSHTLRRRCRLRTGRFDKLGDRNPKLHSTMHAPTTLECSRRCPHDYRMLPSPSNARPESRSSPGCR